MSRREVYLAKTRISPTLRAHFAIFIPNENCDRPKTDLTIDFWLRPSIGTIIHVVGEPAVAGFSFEVKRNFDTSTERFLQEMILLGSVDPMHLSGANNAIDITDDAVVRDREPKGRLEEVAALVTPPPGGQNIRIPVNGMTTKRCQEWTIECISRLEDEGIISLGASDIARAQRDAPNFGIFGFRAQTKRKPS